MRLHNSWSLLINREFDNFNKQCIADYEEVVAEYKRFHVDTEKDYGIDAATTQKQTHDDSSPFDYDDPLRAYEAFLADELADDINNTAHINVPEYFDIDCDDANVGNESGERRSRGLPMFMMIVEVSCGKQKGVLHNKEVLTHRGCPAHLVLTQMI